MNDKLISNQLVAAIRKVHIRYDPIRKIALEEAKLVATGRDKLGRIRRLTFYKCACCKGKFKSDEVQVDHIDPVGSQPRYPEDYESDYFKGWFWKLFSDLSNYQVLCRGCHRAKSDEEKKRGYYDRK